MMLVQVSSVLISLLFATILDVNPDNYASEEELLTVRKDKITICLIFMSLLPLAGLISISFVE